MYFLVNASPKRVDVATSNFADALVRSKAGICDGVSSTDVLLKFNFHISKPQHKLWVLKRIVSLRPSFCAPKTYIKTD